MKKQLLVLALCIAHYNLANALQITEIFSNPTSDDSGREWVEIYNDTATLIDLSSISLSIKGGSPVSATLVTGDTKLLPGSYAVIGSTVGGVTKVGLDYPTYVGTVLKANISLVNTGVTSIDIRLLGSVVDSISSYTAAREGYSYARVGTTFSVVEPTFGKENSASSQTVPLTDQESTTTQIVGNQATIPQMSPPSADIVIYLPQERTVVAGAPSIFSTSALTQSGKQISNVSYTWSFGDGGQGTGSTTVYRYFYPGRYVAYVDASNGLVAGKARMLIKVVSPELNLSGIRYSKYGSYVELGNPNPYELDISTWKLSIDGAMYSLPINTVLLPGTTTVHGLALGFASTSVRTDSVIRLLFSNNEEVARAPQAKYEEATYQKGKPSTASSSYLQATSHKGAQKPIAYKISKKPNTAPVEHAATTTEVVTVTKKDQRIANFFRNLFK